MTTVFTPRLGTRDWIAVEHVLRELYAEDALTGLPRQIMRLVCSLIPADSARIGRLNPTTGRLELWESAGQPLPARFPQLISRYIPEHPLVQADRHGAGGVSLRMSDVMSHREFRRRPLYQEAYRLIGTRYQLSFGRWTGSPNGLGLALDRGDRDFSQRERSILEVLRPHLEQALRIAIALGRVPASPGVVAPDSRGVLTPRETEVLHWLNEGKTNMEISVVLGVSRFTVKNHLQNIFRKLGVETRMAASRVSHQRELRSGIPAPFPPRGVESARIHD